MPKFAILVLSSKTDPYVSFRRAQEETWVLDAEREGIPVFFAEGIGTNINPNLYKNIDVTQNMDTLEVDCSDTLKGTLLKTIASLRYIFTFYEVNYVLRTNLSSFINISQFLKCASDKCFNDTTYAGVVGKTRTLREFIYINEFYKLSTLSSFCDFWARTVNFASGAAFVIGRQKFNDLEGTKQFRNFIDDVGIGYHLNIARNSIQDLERFSLSLQDFQKNILSNCSHDIFLQNNGFHYRCKNINRSDDIQLIKKLGEYFG